MDDTRTVPGLPGLTEILDAVAREVAGLAQLTTGLQERLSPLSCAVARDDRVLQELQALDFIAQHLCGTADFLNALAPTLPAGWTGDAAAAARIVNLSSLARRLGHPSHAPSFADDPDFADDEEGSALELFSADDA